LLFLTNYALVLYCVAEDPEIRIREIAAKVGITERSAQRIVAELVEDGYLDVQRAGRRNRYTINRDGAVRHKPLEIKVGALLDCLAG
jgi:predicted transcriptional regulator